MKQVEDMRSSVLNVVYGVLQGSILGPTLFTVYINDLQQQTIQNTGLYIVYNQHYLPFDRKDSTETLHRRANLYRLVHQRRIHMMSFVYNYVNDPKLVDVKNINTRMREGILFRPLRTDHYNVRQDPLWRAIEGWNKLPLYILYHGLISKQPSW